MGAAASPSTESQAEERDRVEQGRPERCWLGWGGSGTARVGRGRARPGRRRLGQSGPSAAEVLRGGSGVKRGQGGAGQGGWGRAPPARGRVRRQREEQLVAAAARVAIQRVEEMCVREKREKERAGSVILTYIRRADTT
jgi:hypothetical protein